MSEARTTEYEAPVIGATPPAVAFLQMLAGYMVWQGIYVAAKLGLADLLATGPVRYDELAATTQTHAPSLYRLLRALASQGVFAEGDAGQFALTPLGALLQSNTPGSLRALAIMHGEECYRAWGDLLHSIRTGEVALEHHFGMPLFEYLAQHPEAGQIFNEAMTGYINQIAGAAVASYDFSAFATVVDVGGGYGALLAAILQSSPAARGILFDQPHVVAGADAFLTAAGVAERCERVGGDFFAAVPAGGDAYVLSGILHDWDDEHCLAILKQCRQVMPAHGRLLVIEVVLPPGNEPSLAKWMDLNMLAITGGKERTAAEYGTLFRAAGFELTRIVPMPAGASVVEGVPV